MIHWWFLFEQICSGTSLSLLLCEDSCVCPYLMIFRKPVSPKRSNARLFLHSGINEGKTESPLTEVFYASCNTDPLRLIITCSRMWGPRLHLRPRFLPLCSETLKGWGLRNSRCPWQLMIGWHLENELLSISGHGSTPLSGKHQFHKPKANCLRSVPSGREREREGGKVSPVITIWAGKWRSGWKLTFCSCGSTGHKPNLHN